MTLTFPRIPVHREPERGHPAAERGRRAGLSAEQMVGQQLHSGQGQGGSCAAARLQGNVRGACVGPDAWNTAGHPGACFEESQQCGRAEGGITSPQAYFIFTSS